MRLKFFSAWAVVVLPLAVGISSARQVVAQTNSVAATIGTNQYKMVQDAINATPQNASRANPCIVHVKPGVHKELIYVQHEKRYVHLVGDDAEKTVITYNLSARMPGFDGRPMTTYRTPTAVIDADDFTVENITFENTAGLVGQALAIRIDGDRMVFRNCRFRGWHDTILANRGRQYFENCYIEGNVDFIFGGATTFFENCHIHCLTNGYISAASTPEEQTFGFVFSHCRITGEPGVRTYLGRPWRGYSSAVYLNTEMSSVVTNVGWDNWKDPAREKTVRYAEFNSTGPGANPEARVPWSHQLTKAEAEAYTVEKVLGGADGWNPKNEQMKFVLAFILIVSLSVRFVVAADKAAPAIKPDLVVAADGSGDFKTVQEAINAVPHDNHQRMIIFIKNGLYHEKVRIDPNFITLCGESRQGTRIEFPQGTDDFTNHPDDIGRAVVNINGSDCVLQNLTVKNTHGVIGPHAFAIYGHGDKTVIVDCNVWSQGADTLALWGDRSGSYQARLDIRGSVDFVCPRGWCYMTDCMLHQVNPHADATIWHDGSRDPDMKFVLRNCRFDGAGDVPSWILARHHHDAQFFLLDCTFSKTLSNRPPQRVIYPLNEGPPSEADIRRNRELDGGNIWGERAYFYNCHRDGGDYPWQQDNLSSAPDSPTPQQISAAWTFAGKWDPERHDGPTINKITQRDGWCEVNFSESVTVKGKPRLVFKSGGFADYAVGSGSHALIFASHDRSPNEVSRLDLQGGYIFASEAAASLRLADLSVP